MNVIWLIEFYMHNKCENCIKKNEIIQWWIFLGNTHTNNNQHLFRKARDRETAIWNPQWNKSSTQANNDHDNSEQCYCYILINYYWRSDTQSCLEWSNEMKNKTTQECEYRNKMWNSWKKWISTQIGNKVNQSLKMR